MTNTAGWGTPPDHGWGGWAPPPPPKPGVIPLAPLSLGDILGGAFSTLGRHWKQLLGVAFAVYAVALLAIGAVLGIAYLSVADWFEHLRDGRSDAPFTEGDALRPILLLGALYLFAVVVVLAANAVIQASCPVVLQDAVLGRPTTFGAVWRRAWSRMWAVLGTVLLTGLIVLVPVLFLVVSIVALAVALLSPSFDGPGGLGWLALIGALGVLATTPLAVWLWVRFSLAPAVAVFEKQGVIASLSRSSRLVHGSWWRIFGITLLGYGIAAVTSYLVQMPLSMLSMLPTAGLSTGDAPSGGAVLGVVLTVLGITLVAALVGQVFTAAFPPLVTSLLYVDQRMRKEDLAPVLAQAANVPPAAAGP